MSIDNLSNLDDNLSVRTGGTGALLISRCEISPPSGVSRIFGNSSSGKPARPGAIDPPTRRIAWNIYIGRA
jgi:hypothetical protein